MYFTTSAPNFLWGGCFQLFTKNRPQKHQKRALLHSSQANGGALEPPRPPLATLLLTCILQPRIQYAAQSRALGQVQQQQQINSVRYNNNNTATSSLCVLCRLVGVAS